MNEFKGSYHKTDQYRNAISRLKHFTKGLFYIEERLYSVQEIEYVIPYGMGAGLAGGDWQTVYEICCGFLGEDNIIVLKKD